MRRRPALAALLSLAATPAWAQDAPVARRLSDINIASGFITADQHLRASKILGATVYNQQGEKLGKVEEILLSRDDQATHAVLSVGGYLGVGSKLVEVAFAQLQIRGSRVVLAGMSKDALTGLPSYRYNKPG